MLRASLLCHNTSDEKKCLITLTPGDKVIKLFAAAIYEWTKQAREFVPGKATMDNPLGHLANL